MKLVIDGVIRASHPDVYDLSEDDNCDNCDQWNSVKKTLDRCGINHLIDYTNDAWEFVIYPQTINYLTESVMSELFCDVFLLLDYCQVVKFNTDYTVTVTVKQQS